MQHFKKQMGLLRNKNKWIKKDYYKLTWSVSTLRSVRTLNITGMILY